MSENEFDGSSIDPVPVNNTEVERFTLFYTLVYPDSVEVVRISGDEVTEETRTESKRKTIENILENFIDVLDTGSNNGILWSLKRKWELVRIKNEFPLTYPESLTEEKAWKMLPPELMNEEEIKERICHWEAELEGLDD